MRILFLNKMPKKAAAFDDDKVEKLLNSYASPGTEIDLANPEPFAGSQIGALTGRQSKLNGLDHMVGAGAIIQKALWAAENGYDVVVQSNTFDPGVDGGRMVCTIPIIGPFRTSVHVASILADRIGIVVPLASHVPLVWRMLRSVGMKDHVVDIRAHGIYGSDISERKEEITGVTLKVIEGLVRDGAEAIIPLGGALIPYIVDPADLEAQSGVQVLNIAQLSIKFAETCVNMGLKQSGFTYPLADLTSADFA